MALFSMEQDQQAAHARLLAVEDALKAHEEYFLVMQQIVDKLGPFIEAEPVKAVLAASLDRVEVHKKMIADLRTEMRQVFPPQ